MNAIMIIELKKHIQDKGLLFWMLILPIIFTVLFIAMFTANVDAATKQQVILSIVPGYVVMFVFFIMISMVQVFIKDRDKGMTSRLASTPIPPYFYLLGKWIPFMYIVLVQIIVLFLFGRLVYDVPLGQPFVLLILSICLTFTVTGIGLAMSVIVRTENMGIALTQIVALGGAMLSGLWVPLEMMPDFMQTISRFLPQYWAHQAFQDAMAGNTVFTELLQTLLILFGIGVAGFVIAILRYPHFLKRSVN
ncbi:ABC transporter permease [Virgibacillus profundi]|uniref:Transport permease protein n=1 Tax=Virgibacillus profundi TaxID=2024555 RepID=A0A2A2IGR2_9BACI|nr:ABC transporter permease [Virgibacillus profundi]PAV30506.1 ABC transporter permease [Virgibacillus profundi]PXY54678.1 ABC transporter permease [Virgibacillus profundi]